MTYLQLISSSEDLIYLVQSSLRFLGKYENRTIKISNVKNKGYAVLESESYDHAET